VYFVADARYTSLLNIHSHSHWKGESAGHGEGSNCHGKNGAEVEVPLPVGTVIRVLPGREAVCDLTEPGQRFRAARGGQGGRGNARFATATRRVPRFAERAEPGEDAEYELELKIIAEVGLVGLPNAGKSTFLAATTAARPKIADYPFTTLSPNLGVAHLGGYRTLTIADIPGIIEGASQGKGLGHEFLRHIERTKVLLFIIDLGDEDPVSTRELLEAELVQHSPVFAQRPKLVVLNKADIPENRARFESLEEEFGRPFRISAVTREGLPELLEELWRTVERSRREEAGLSPAESQQEQEYVYEPAYVIKKVSDGFRIDGKVIGRVVKMTDFGNEDAVRYLQQKLKRMGVFKALKRQGAKEGQAIWIGDVELEYRPDKD
jgi:GTP-binding protein